MTQKLWRHQELGVELARRIPSLALLFDAGTGKSAATINILREDFNRYRRIARTLIFCPVSVCPQWKTEFEKFSKIPQEKIHVLVGPGKERVKRMEEIGFNGGILVTNYEAVQIEAFYKKLVEYEPEIIIADELHRLKDSTSVRAKKIYPLADKAPRKIGLTGTPILNSMLDLFGQFRFVNPDIFGKNFFVFKNKYFYDKNSGMPAHCHFPDWQPRPNAEKYIGDKIKSISVQAKKFECLDMPDLQKILVPVEMDSKQRKSYEMMKKEFVAEVKDKVITAEFALTKSLRLQQIIAGFIHPEGDEKPTWFEDVSRIQALSELLESIGQEKVIIWSNFIATYSKIQEVCDKLKKKSVLLTGQQSAKEKQESIETFRFGDGQVLVSNPASGGVGLNLTEAKYAIYYSRGYSLEHYLQSEARNVRGNSKDYHDKIIHYHLVAKDSLDEIILDALANKKAIGDAVLEWSRKNY